MLQNRGIGVTRQIWLIAGLGNPGKQYEQTWHNTGYQVMDRLAARHQLSLDRIRFRSLTAEGMIGAHPCLLLKPLTFMNLSGEAVGEAARYYRVAPENILVIYDDIDLTRGSIRIRRTGGPGTHNGMRSIIDCLQTRSFPRLRVGIGPKPDSWDLADYVLSGIPPEQRDSWSESLSLAADAVDKILHEDLSRAMGLFNRR